MIGLMVPSVYADVTFMNFRDVQQNPDSFIGDSVNLTGKITNNNFQDGGVVIEVGGLGIGSADISDRIKYQILFEKSQNTNTGILVKDNCVKVTGEITGSITVTGFGAGEFTFPTAEIFTVDLIDCIYGFYPVLGDLDYAWFDENGVSLTEQNGVAKVTLKKMEFTTGHTRIFLDIENTGSSGKIEFNEQNSVIIQNDQQQLTSIHTSMVRGYPEKIDSAIHPGAITSGWIMFEIPIVSPFMADRTFEIRLNITDAGIDNDIIFLIHGNSFKLIGVYAESKGFVSVPEVPAEPEVVVSEVQQAQAAAEAAERVLQEKIETEQFTANMKQKSILSFVDPEKDPSHYVKRYITEETYKDWFTEHFPDYTLYEGIGITQEEYRNIVIELTTPESVAIPIEETYTPEPEPEPESEPRKSGGGCLIATAAFGSEMAPQVQFLRELRDNTVLSTQSGTTFMTGFNQFYYSFSPYVADYERENPVFKEAVKVTLTPLLTSLTLLNYVDVDTEEEMLGYGIGIILLNIGMYFVAPAILIISIRKHFHSVEK
jgi:hypothetical protein